MANWGTQYLRNAFPFLKASLYFIPESNTKHAADNGPLRRETWGEFYWRQTFIILLIIIIIKKEFKHIIT